jgi:hypothetical protein
MGHPPARVDLMQQVPVVRYQARSYGRPIELTVAVIVRIERLMPEGALVKRRHVDSWLTAPCRRGKVAAGWWTVNPGVV